MATRSSDAGDGLDGLIPRLPDIVADHAPSSPRYRDLKDRAAAAVAAQFGNGAPQPGRLEPFGDLHFPYMALGNTDSLGLLGLDELILFAFYWRNRARYRRAVDFGANIGLHSTILCRCGFEVRSFEPDPLHVEALRARLAANDCTVELHEAAVSTKAGRHSFTRVLGNTTGSHLSGEKASPYGALETFEVALEAAAPHMAWADLVKMDIEGHEAEVLCDTAAEIWRDTDAVVKVGSADNAARIFDRFAGLPVNLFAQKIAWRKVETAGDMPTSHRDGSLFVSVKDAMPWV
jgi:FkbM family methyltransferase